jgi:ABC-type amino acid transport system permease subunit
VERAVEILSQYYPYLLNGLKITVLVTLVSGALGTAIGLVLALMRLSMFTPFKFLVTTGLYKRNNKFIVWLAHFNPLSFIAKVYIEVIRGTPSMVQLVIFAFIIFVNTDSRFMIASVAFGINSGAYVAELIRAGIQAVDKGQMEAGRSLGLSYGMTMRYVIIPQAVKNILPALANEFIVLLKETSIVGVIGLDDLVRAGNIIRSRTYDAYVPLLTVAAIYLCMTLTLSNLLARFERRLRQSD